MSSTYKKKVNDILPIVPPVETAIQIGTSEAKLKHEVVEYRIPAPWGLLQPVERLLQTAGNAWIISFEAFGLSMGLSQKKFLLEQSIQKRCI